MKLTALLAFLTAAIGLFATAESISDEQGNKDAAPSKPDASDKFIGQEAGQLRDDNGLKMKLVWCPSGKFLMGTPSSEPDRDIDEKQVTVTLTTGFWLGKYEVTQSEWENVMQTEPWKGQDYTREGADFPATFIDWDDAMQFCLKLTEQERRAGRLLTGWEYTLPTEAQWEHACRAGTETRFSFGADESKLGDYGWFFDNAWNAGEQYAHRVGRKKANPWGLYDMHGNVWELCRDLYAEQLPGGRDPDVKSNHEGKASYQLIRGGSWGWVAAICRSGNRSRPLPGNRIDSYGLRVALSSVR